MSHTPRNLSREFILLEQRLSVVPTRALAQTMKAAGKWKVIHFTKANDESEIGQLLASNFPALMGIDPNRLVFLISFNSNYFIGLKTRLLGHVRAEIIEREIL